MQATQTQTLHYQALAYLAQLDGEHVEGDRDSLIDRCVSHLVDTRMSSIREAMIVAAQALGELQAKECKAYIDTSISTSYTLFIRDPLTSTVRAFTVAELLDLIEPAVLAG